ncbi:MAG: hypothetical protein KKF62_04335 [Bacteroidetes bacterium]|nr:hypothetical protein [Bacteroidota bacterium]MBU1115659.1 hypothetical protein [Bacteroidota bacterium]MBU1799028.1 hypothetical protein [Bacteroidota bacterium]
MMGKNSTNSQCQYLRKEFAIFTQKLPANIKTKSEPVFPRGSTSKTSRKYNAR